MNNINEKLLQLNFIEVDPYDFAKLLFEECNEQSFFEPLKHEIPKHLYIQLLEKFEKPEELAMLANQEFFELMRLKVLEVNGFDTKDGYFENETNVKDIKVYLYQ